VSAPVILALMSFCFLFFGYLGVPVPFSLMAGVFVGALLTDVSLTALIPKRCWLFLFSCWSASS
jgi:C4-dicarboxylate transporter, DctM subunit